MLEPVDGTAEEAGSEVADRVPLVRARLPALPRRRLSATTGTAVTRSGGDGTAADAPRWKTDYPSEDREKGIP